MRVIIRRIGATRTVLLSTHILPEVELTCDRVMIINRGRLVADGATKTILTGGTEYSLTLGFGVGKVDTTEGALRTEIEKMDHVISVAAAAPVNEVVRLTVRTSEDIRADLFGWAVRQGHVLVELATDKRNLEDVFERLTVGNEESGEE